MPSIPGRKVFLDKEMHAQIIKKRRNLWRVFEFKNVFFNYCTDNYA